MIRKKACPRTGPKAARRRAAVFVDCLFVDSLGLKRSRLKKSAPGRGLAGCARGRVRRLLPVLDHRLAPQIREIALRLGAEFLFEYLVARFLHARRIALGLPLRADREHLYALAGLLGRCQMAEFGTVENLAQILGKVR